MWRAVEPSLLGECPSSARSDSQSAPCSRAKHSATLVDGYVYILAGRGGGGGSMPLKDFWRYCLATGRWERLPMSGNAPGSLQEHSAVGHGTKLYVFGGEASHGNEVPLWIFDTQTHEWRKIGGPMGRGGSEAPCNRRGHSAHSLPDCLLLYGGYKDLRGSTNELWAFHYELERWQLVRTAGVGPARHRHAAGLEGGRLYVHGGQKDLADCGDLHYYHLASRRWVSVRGASKVGPSPRWGHAGVSAGGALYIYGGHTHGHPTNELWNFTYASETWQRMSLGLEWPSARVDAKILLVPGGCGILKFRSRPVEVVSSPPRRPSSLLSRARGSGESRGGGRGGRYSILSPDTDSTETLLRGDTPPPPAPSPPHLPEDRSPPEGDLPDYTLHFPRGLISVPDFADLVLPTPVLSPVEAAKLVYLDSDEEEEMRREREMMRENEWKQRPLSEIKPKETSIVVALPKSASVRFSKRPTIFYADDEAELSTSDYASAEKVNRLSSISGFTNPHYMGPDVRQLGVALTPDSGVGPADIELQDFSHKKRRPEEKKELHILLVGGKEPPHLALLQRPLSMWTYRLL